MKSSHTFVALVSSLMLIGSGAAFADVASDARAATIASIQIKYNPGFDGQYVRILAAQVKAANDAGTSKAIKSMIKDFLGMRKIIDTSLANLTSDLDTVLGFAEEELGEFNYSIDLLEQQIAKSKTLTCVKGKTVKKIMAIKPVCPRGYLKK